LTDRDVPDSHVTTTEGPDTLWFNCFAEVGGTVIGGGFGEGEGEYVAHG
jgi:hypothetical protein